MSPVRVSVIIPYSKPNLVEATLEGLAQQTFPTDQTEILVVGSGSASLADRWPIRAVESSPIFFPGVARNLGARVAEGEYLLCLDDDCEPAPDWIEQNLRELAVSGVGAVGAQIAGKSSAFFGRCVDFSSFAFYQSGRRAEMPVCSASLAMTRSAFEAVGGFNEELRSGEDVDFCYRLMRLGYTTVYQPAVKVKHNHGRTTFGALVRYSYFYGRVKGLYVKRRYHEMSIRNRILTVVQQPALYLCMIAPISAGITAIIVRRNAREHPAIFLYAPFIFLAKVAYHLGIWQWIRQGPPAAAAARTPPNAPAIYHVAER